MKNKNNLKAVLISFSLAVFTVLFVFLLNMIPGFSRLNDSLYDSMFRGRADNSAAAEDVVIVALDDNSLVEMQNSEMAITWPWPRFFYGMMADYLISCGAKSVVFDMVFSEPSMNSGWDDYFGSSITDKPVVLGFNVNRSWGIATDVPEISGSHFSLKNLENIAEYNFITPPYSVFQNTTLPGFVDVQPGEDGVVRSYKPLVTVAGKPYMSLAAAAIKAEGVTPAQLSALDSFGQFTLNWYGRGGANGVFRYVSALDVLDSARMIQAGFADMVTLKPEVFKGKTVFIGSTVTAHGDVKSTPFSANAVDVYPGVEVHATAYLNMKNGDWVKVVTLWPQLLILFVVMFCISYLGLRLRSYFTFTCIYAGSAIISLLIPLLLFYIGNYKTVFDLIILALVMIYILSLAANYVIIGRSRTVIKNAMGKYLSPEILKKVMASGEALVGGDEINASVMFIDIAGFTTYSEAHPVKEVVSVLNLYLKSFSEIIIRNQGYVNKFLGDGLMALFGSPEAHAEHADMAVKSAFECYEVAQRLGAEHGLHIRVGVNSGKLIHGNIGGTNKLEFTAIGDIVNSASRMEGVNKFFGTGIVIGENTFELLEQVYPLEYAGRFSLKGKVNAVKLFCYSDASEGEKEIFAKLIDFYEQKNEQAFKKILSLFEKNNFKYGPVIYYKHLYEKLTPEQFGEPVKLTEK